MQFDASMMKRLLAADDASLWEAVRAAAAQNGISLPKGQPSTSEMAKLRSVLGGVGEGDVKEAMEVLRRARGEG